MIAKTTVLQWFQRTSI